ncbi:MAG: prepilin-type N-terminal cleavage/methylation domain-containing protein [Candidatus Aminicenantes bacterium]
MKLKQKGFTLIEVMISLSIFAVLILGTSQLMIHSLIVQDRCQNRLVSLELAANKIETLKSLSFDHSELKKESQEEIIKTGTKKEFLLKTSIQDISPGIKRIIVSCSAANKNEKEITFAVYISREIGF